MHGPFVQSYIDALGDNPGDGSELEDHPGGEHVRTRVREKSGERVRGGKGYVSKRGERSDPPVSSAFPPDHEEGSETDTGPKRPYSDYSDDDSSDSRQSDSDECDHRDGTSADLKPLKLDSRARKNVRLIKELLAKGERG